ncbi:hypothetical protein ACIREM_36060 [Streptomyces shenzhenensis]
MDGRELAARYGVLAAAGLARTAADAALGERSVRAPVGLPWQDLAPPPA